MATQEIATPQLAKVYPTGDEPNIGDILSDDILLDAPLTKQDGSASLVLKANLKPILGQEELRFFKLEAFKASPFNMFDYGYILANGAIYQKTNYPNWSKLVVAGLAGEIDEATFQVINACSRYQKFSLSNTDFGLETLKSHAHGSGSITTVDAGELYRLRIRGSNSSSSGIMLNAFSENDYPNGDAGEPVNDAGNKDIAMETGFTNSSTRSELPVNDRPRDTQGDTATTTDTIYQNLDELGSAGKVNPLFFTMKPYVYFGQNQHGFENKPVAKTFTIKKYVDGVLTPSAEQITLAGDEGFNPDLMEEVL